MMMIMAKIEGKLLNCWQEGENNWRKTTNELKFSQCVFKLLPLFVTEAGAVKSFDLQ